jgi:hypothetical protein
VRRILPSLIHSGNVVLLLGWRNLAWMIVAVVLALLVLLYLIDCCSDGATTD